MRHMGRACDLGRATRLDSQLPGPKTVKRGWVALLAGASVGWGSGAARALVAGCIFLRKERTVIGSILVWVPCLFGTPIYGL